MGIYESPKYDIIKSDGSIEIRKYYDFYIVEYDNDKDPDISNGFGSLFSYISTDNKENRKISMTIPVIEEVSGDKKKMAFVVPKKLYNKIPEPNNPLLNIREFRSGLFGVIRYSGLSSRSKEEKKTSILSKWLRDNGYKIDSNFMLAFYNPPFTPPFLRRNEIWVRVIINE